jgi:hypothetical protein
MPLHRQAKALFASVAGKKADQRTIAMRLVHNVAPTRCLVVSLTEAGLQQASQDVLAGAAKWCMMGVSVAILLLRGADLMGVLNAQIIDLQVADVLLLGGVLRVAECAGVDFAAPTA